MIYIEPTELNEIIIKPRFCEIDSLLIVHHSRFVPWVEEANFTFFERVLNIKKKDFLELGMYNPIQSLYFKYKNFVTWEDEVLIKVTMEYSQFAHFTMHNVLCSRENQKKIFALAEVSLLITNKEMELKLMAPNFFISKIREAEEVYPMYFKNNDHA